MMDYACNPSNLEGRYWEDFFLIFILFICAYNVWVISSPFPHPLPYPPTPLPLPPTPLLPGRNYFALISNFVEERVQAIIGWTKDF
jgi:hypothetical protein